MLSFKLIERIKLMEGVGFHASENSLPLLFKEVYGVELGKCHDCRIKAFETLIRWAKKQTKETNSYMKVKIKKEYENHNFAVTHKGVNMFINSANLNDELAHVMLSIPKYAHAIEGQPDKVEVVESPNVSEASTVSTSQTAKDGGKGLVKAKGGKLVKSKG